MIYSVSRRTDMPAFFPDRIVERVRRARKLEALVFWTKDIRNLVRHPGLAETALRLPSVVQFTVTGLAGTVWEPGVPPPDSQLAELEELARRLPKGAIRWRFDPVLALPGDDALARFNRVKEKLDAALGGLDGVTVSFPDPYRHAVRRTLAAGLEWPALAAGEKRALVEGMVAAFAGGGAVRLCCEPSLLAVPGVAMARCVDGELLERLYGPPLGGLAKDPGQRAACGCVKSTDIGSYDLRCGHGCLYCYAAR